MCAWDDQNYVMAAGTKPGSDTNTTDGIVDGHAYTVITCLNDVAGTTHDLIKVAYQRGSECRSKALKYGWSPIANP